MPRLTSDYPAGLPQFIAGEPAPYAWQERLQRVDRDLWLCWNPFHRQGATWCVVRYHARVGNSVPIVGIAQHADWSDLWGALKAGWAIVVSLFDPDGKPCGLEGSWGDVVLEELANADLKGRWGDERPQQEKRLAQSASEAKGVRKSMHDANMKEAFDATLEDEKTDNIVGKPYKSESALILPGSKDWSA